MMVWASALAIRAVIAISLVDLGGAEAHRHTRTGHGDWSVQRCFWYAVVAHLGPDTRSDAGTAGGVAERGVVRATGDLHVGAHFGLALLGEYSRVFILGAVAPDGGFLFPHEGDVRGG